MKSNKIEKLKTKLRSLSESETAVKTELQKEYNKVFDADKELQEVLAALDMSNEYGADDGGIYAWTRYPGLSDWQESEREYLDEYLSANSGSYANYANDALKAYQGGCITINDCYGRDDGDVYDSDSGKCIIQADEYRDEDGELDESERNALIEAYMERTGYFPGVFRCDSHGNVFPVNTKAGVT